jgi:hypothetical protein
VDLLKVIGVVRRDMEQAMRLERAMDGIQERCGHNSTPMMPPFGPWIGKQQVERFDRFRRKKRLNRVSRFRPQHSQILNPIRLSAGLGHTPGQSFDPEEILAGI